MVAPIYILSYPIQGHKDDIHILHNVQISAWLDFKDCPISIRLQRHNLNKINVVKKRGICEVTTSLLIQLAIPTNPAL